MEAAKNIKTAAEKIDEMKEYWVKRYNDGGKIWGDIPSLSAKQAGVLFESCKVESVLVPGCGYGRHTSYFDNLGFDVSGIEITREAINIARSERPHIKYYEGSVLDMPFSDSKYDGIYCFNVLHLLMSKDRQKFIENCKRALNDRGYIYFTVVSEQEASYGNGPELESNTFESKPGRPAHYFTEADLKESFIDFEILDMGIIEEEENHGETGHHIHKIRYIFARKR